MKKKSAFTFAGTAIASAAVAVVVAATLASVDMVNKAEVVANKWKSQLATPEVAAPIIPPFDGMTFWFDPTREEFYGNKPTDGADVTLVKDLSNNNFIVDKSPSGLYPSYVASGIGGLPSLKCQPGERIYSKSTPITAGDPTYSLVGLWRFDGNPINNQYANAVIFGQSGGASYKSANLFLHAGTGKHGFEAGVFGYYPKATVIGREYLVIITINNSQSTKKVKIYSNSNTALTYNHGTNLEIANSTFLICNTRVDGLISELMVFDHDLTQTEAEAVNSYYSAKYGISIN